MKLWNPDAGSPARSRVVVLLPLVALGLVLLYAGFVVMVWWFQERIVFQPPSAPVSMIGARRANYRTSDGIDLFAYVVGDCAPTTTAVLAFHGNADVARWLVPWATHLSTSAEAPRALVLQSPFSTIRAMASRIFLPGLGAFALISRFHFDIIIPVRMGREGLRRRRTQGTAADRPWRAPQRRSAARRTELLEMAQSRRSRRNTTGTLIDSASVYFHASFRLLEIGLVRVGEV